MRIWLTRLEKILLIFLVGALVFLALAASGLRLLLPEANYIKQWAQEWVSEQAQIQFTIDDVKGSWANTRPSLVLQGVQANLPNSSQIHFYTDYIELEIDLLETLLQQRLVIAYLNIDRMNLDMSAVNWSALSEDNKKSNEQILSQENVLAQFDNLLLRQLADFTLHNSTIWYRAINGDVRQLAIEKLRWQNQEDHHFAEGQVSLVDKDINSLHIKADFYDQGSLQALNGQFYVSADSLHVRPWLSQYLQQETGILQGNLSFDAWFELKNSQPQAGYLRLNPSELVWQAEQTHALMLESGIVELIPDVKGWQLNAHQLVLRTDDLLWPRLDMAFLWQSDHWYWNISRLELKTLTPLAHLVPQSLALNHWLEQLKPQGELSDIRLSKGEDWASFRYSAQIDQAGIEAWDVWLPQVRQLQGQLSGSLETGQITAQLIDETLPYSAVFAEPLMIEQGQVRLVWQHHQEGWTLWSDDISARTPHLQATAEFRVDFQPDTSPLLSFYLEADTQDAAQTWRYLPRPALGDELTDYLSQAIQGGKVNKAQLLWYGALDAFPYAQQEGVFQAKFKVDQAQFEFDPYWPTLKDLSIDLLFENDRLSFTSHAAPLAPNVVANYIKGFVPELAEDGKLLIDANVKALQASGVREYMLASVLADSVGAALTEIEVTGAVTSEFKLEIPFNTEHEVKAKGWVALANNTVSLPRVDLHLTQTSGKLFFEQEQLWGSEFNTHWLQQPLSVSFQGKPSKQGYQVDVQTQAHWQPQALMPYIDAAYLAPLTGEVPWQIALGVQIGDDRLSYQLDAQAQLNDLVSQYPYPLNLALNNQQEARLQLSGNQEVISARLQLPNIKYQAEIGLTAPEPQINASYLSVGNGGFRVSPVAGHQWRVRLDTLDADAWLEWLNQTQFEEEASTLATDFVFPLAQKIEVKVDELQLAQLAWHNVDISARQNAVSWLIQLASTEAQGQASYLAPYDLTVALERLNLYLPWLDKVTPPHNSAKHSTLNKSVTEFERQFHQQIPNLTLMIDDFWLQGYKVGKVNMDFQRQGETLEWKNIDINSGTNHLQVKGSWTLSGDQSDSQMSLSMQGENNSDLMERFGVSSGIQKAPFEMHSQLAWQGAPWSMQVDTLEGEVDIKLGKGVISQVGGAARLLGLFSLDSIMRKMQLDFSDIFDKGMLFDSITGSGRIQQGVFVTDNIKMDALAGEMKIKGFADLNDRTVNANVSFTPDITSGLPVISAFAVNPITAIYVFAVTTVFSPVVEVFTQVNYQVTGPIESPNVKEVSRRKRNIELPEHLLTSPVEEK